MLFILFASVFSFQLKGRWNVTVTGNRIDDTSFKINLKNKEGKFVGQTIVNKRKEFIPKKIHVKELESDKHYILILPYNKEPKFADFHFKQEGNALVSNVNSTDKNWNVTATIVPSKSITIFAKSYQKKIWYTYTAIPIERVQTKFNWPLIGLVALGIPIVSVTVYKFIKHDINIKPKTE